MQSELAMEQFFRKGPMEAFAKCLRQDIPPQYMNDWYRLTVSIKLKKGKHVTQRNFVPFQQAKFWS